MMLKREVVIPKTRADSGPIPPIWWWILVTSAGLIFAQVLERL